MTLIKFFYKQIFDIKTFGFSEILKKFYLFIKFLINSPVLIVAIIPCIIIRLISPWIIVRIQKVPSNNFGDFVQLTAMYYCKKKLKIDQPEKKYIDFLYIDHKDKIFNRQLAKMWKRKLNFFSSYLLDPISRINKFFPNWKFYTIETLYIKRERDVNNLFEKCKPLEFTKEEEKKGKELLKKFGLKDNDKFVCLAVRDEAYQFKKISPKYRNWDYHDFRHTDINNFKLAAEELANKGYFVFRMGVIAKKSFNLNNPKIIDYANSSLRNDFMDIYLGAKCFFCISTDYGFQDLPCLFGKPLVQMGVPLGNLFSYNEKFLLMTKHHFFKKEKRKLSLSEIFSHGVAYSYYTRDFEQKEIDLIENSPEEIKDLAIEMVEKLESKRILNIEDKKLQEKFRNLYASNIKRYNYKKVSESLSHITMHGQIKSSFSTKFLRENKNWLK